MEGESRPASRDAGRSSRPTTKSAPEPKKRDKSRTRTIFSRKKSMAQIAPT